MPQVSGKPMGKWAETGIKSNVRLKKRGRRPERYGKRWEDSGMKLEIALKGRIAKNGGSKVLTVDDGSTIEIFESDSESGGREVVIRVLTEGMNAVSMEDG